MTSMRPRLKELNDNPYLKNKLGRELEELSNLLKTDVDETAYKLYEASDGKPCFVEFNQKENKGQQSILLSVTFFDSIQNKTGNKYVSWKSPLQEKRISYRYNTLSNNASAWIYFGENGACPPTRSGLIHPLVS